MKKINRILTTQEGFTLVEVLAVLVIVAILAVVAIPKYMNATEAARNKAAQGQIAEVKGRFAQGLGRYMMENNGSVPASGAALIVAVESYSAGATAGAEADFTFSSAAVLKVITITVTVVGTAVLVTPQTGTYDFTNAG